VAGRAWVAPLHQRGPGHDDRRTVVSPGLRRPRSALGIVQEAVVVAFDQVGAVEQRVAVDAGHLGHPPRQASHAPSAVAAFFWPGSAGFLLAGNGEQGGLREAGRTPERQHLGLAPTAPARRSRGGGSACWSCLVTGSG